MRHFPLDNNESKRFLLNHAGTSEKPQVSNVTQMLSCNCILFNNMLMQELFFFTSLNISL